MKRILIVSAFLFLSLNLADAQLPKPTEQAWSILQQGVASGDHDTRGRATQALGLLMRDARAMQLAEARLSDDDAEVRAAAALALGQIGLKAAVPALKKALLDDEAEVVFSATSALRQLNDPTAFGVYYAVLTGDRKTGEPLLESQLKKLHDPEALAQISLEVGVGFVPFGGIGYKAVKALTQDKVSPVRAAAAQKLADDPDPASGKALAAATSDEKWLVRAAAISAIAKRGDRSLLPAVTPRLLDENETVKFTAAAATIRLSGRKK